MNLRNETLVGATVVAGIIAILVGSFWLAGREWGVQHLEVVAAFREVGELREGNPVNYRGVNVGEVRTVRLGDLGEGVFVSMRIRDDLHLPDDPAVLIAPASMFGEWQARIVSQSAPGVRQLEFTVSTRPEVLPGATMPDMTELTAVAARIADQIEVVADRVTLAFTEETAIQIREAVGDISEMAAQLSGFVDQQTAVYQDVSREILATAGNISEASTRVTTMVGEVERALEAGDVQRILANVAETSENLRRLSAEIGAATEGVPSLITRADAAMVSFSELAEDVRQVVRVLEPQVEEIGPTLAEAREAMATLRRVGERLEQGDGTLGRLMEDPALYEELQAAITTLRRLMTDVQESPGRYIRHLRLLR